MKPVLQATDSDCMRACVASIFELPLESVPFFGEAAIRDIKDRNNMTEDERSRAALQQADDFAAWLSSMGLCVEYVSDPEACKKRGGNPVKLPWGLCIGDGKSPRGNWAHATVWDCADGTSGTLVHDPHPSGAGLDGRPYLFTCFQVMDPAKFFAGMSGGRNS